MPFIVKNNMAQIRKFNGSHTKPAGERFAFMPDEEREMTDEEVAVLRKKPGFAELEANRSFLVWPAGGAAKDAKGKKPAEKPVDPALAALAAGLAKP